MRAILVTAVVCLATSAWADEAAWLDGLRDCVEADWKASRPLVVQVHVPLCDNTIIRCGGHGLGDGDDPGRNLYWSTSGGFKGWFGRKGSGWTQVAKLDADEAGQDVLEARVWRRSVKKGRDVYVVAFAWRGSEIDRALDAYVADLYGDAAREVTLDDGTVLRAGGAAQIVAWVGHNRLMDLPAYDWSAAARKHEGAAGDAPVKGTIAEACHTASYMAEEVPAARRVPLLMTNDFLFAGAHAFEGAVWAFATGGDYATIRDRAAAQYAEGQDKPKKRVKGAFTNPSDARWKKLSGK